MMTNSSEDLIKIIALSEMTFAERPGYKFTKQQAAILFSGFITITDFPVKESGRST